MIGDAIWWMGSKIFNPKEYAKEYIQDSCAFIKDSLWRLPPDPCPTFVLVALAVSSLRLGQKVVGIGRSVKAVDLITFGGLLVGFHALKTAHIYKLFAKSVENLKEQLDRTERQLDQAEKQLESWEAWYETLRGEVITIQKSTDGLEKAGKKLTAALLTISKSIQLGQKFLRDCHEENEQAKKELVLIIQKREQTNDNLKDLVGKMDQQNQELQKIVPSIENAVMPLSKEVTQMEAAMKAMDTRCSEGVNCPGCKHFFIPYLSFIKGEQNGRHQ